MARPELTDRRPQWPVTVRLEALPADAVDELIGEQVRFGLRERIAMASGGNPLFLTEMLAMASTRDEVEVPPTLRVLLAARLDQLDAPERAVLERGAVEGEIFHRGAVQALAPDEPQVTPRLAALTRKELIRPDQALHTLARRAPRADRRRPNCRQEGSRRGRPRGGKPRAPRRARKPSAHRRAVLAGDLGRELCILGRYEEAEPLAQLGRELGHQQDLATQAIWRQVQALVLASRGKHAEAERFAREAIEFRDHSDAPNRQADARCDLAEVLAAAGRVEEAAEAYEQALDRYGRKKNLAMVAQVQPRLEALLAEANP